MQSWGPSSIAMEKFMSSALQHGDRCHRCLCSKCSYERVTPSAVHPVFSELRSKCAQQCMLCFDKQLPLLVSNFNQNWNLSKHLSKKSQRTIPLKSVQQFSSCYMRIDRQTQIW
jgi:hypothetical protein